jgi:hypothetical protein
MASSPGHHFWLFLVQVVQERFNQAVQLKEERDRKKAEASKNLNEIKESKFDDGDTTTTTDDDNDEVGAEVATGPVVLKEAYDTWQCMLSKEQARMRILPAGYVFVSDWHDDEAREFFDFVCNHTSIMMPKVQRQCQRAYSNAHVITFWSHSWEVPWWEKEDQRQQRREGDGGGEGSGNSSKEDNTSYLLTIKDGFILFSLVFITIDGTCIELLV